MATGRISFSNSVLGGGSVVGIPRHPYSCSSGTTNFADRVVGLVQAQVGETNAVTRIPSIIFPTVITLWVAWMGLRLLRTEAGAARSTP